VRELIGGLSRPCIYTGNPNSRSKLNLATIQNILSMAIRDAACILSATIGSLGLNPVDA
jgi:hypothetical protein